ncbi:MAG: DNA replication/repair protein RecF [Anaerolineales bacterium]|nr:DNA replication/repair protein RecF [Anaerolineales bacterium]
MLQSLPPMHLSHLSLTNYRNFVRLETDLPLGSTILVGANAQGKTSLLEAIYYLAEASSPHATSDRQLINFLAMEETIPFARIVAEIHRGNRINRIEIRIILESVGIAGERRLKKEILVNGLKRRVGDLAGEFNAVMFLPQEMRVIEGPPGERRRHLDSVLSQADPVYAKARSEFAKTLTQRNALLKQIQERNQGNDELIFWDERIADLGSTLIRTRATALNELELLASDIHHQLTHNGEALGLEYIPSYKPSSHPEGQLDLPINAPTDWKTLTRETLRKELIESFHQSRREEIARGVTLFGPHRDDFRFTGNGIDLRLYGSRGQNRTAMLAIKLAEVEWMHERTGEWPVLLLDEVLAELDPLRRNDLLAHVGDVNQAVLTAADLTMFSDSFRGDSTIWRIEAGTITPMIS